MTVDLIACVRENAAHKRNFLLFADSRTVSYADALDRSGRYANVLASLGAATGDRCAVQVEKTEEALYLYLACLRAGIIFLPLNPAYTASEISYFIGDAQPTVFVCDPARRSELAGAAAGVPQVRPLGGDGTGSLSALADSECSDFRDVDLNGDALAAILYTSGTTGRSKGVMLTRDNLASNAAVLADEWRFTERDILLHALPIFHTHGLFVATNTSIVAGSSMLFLPKFDKEQAISLLPRTTVMMGVPTFYTRLLSSPRLTRDGVSHMRLFVSGSAPLSAQTHRDFGERTGHAILERYGMTETNMNTSNPYNGERRAGTVGFPLDGVSLRIADAETGEALADGAVGSIEVRGPNVFKGYWRGPDKTAQDFRPDGFFITGDLGLRSRDGYVMIVGRGKDLIISGGLNVYPAEVEAVVDALPGVAASAIIGVPHPDFGEAVVAVVTARPGATVEEAAIRGACAATLAKFKVPKRVIVVSELPHNAMGKVQKNQLRETLKGLFDAVP